MLWPRSDGAPTASPPCQQIPRPGIVVYSTRPKPACVELRPQVQSYSHRAPRDGGVQPRARHQSRQAVTAVAIWQVYQWTHSSTALGLVGLVNVLPLLALSLPAGAIADHRDRRRLIALGTAVIAVVNVGLAALAFGYAFVPDAAPLRFANIALRHVALLFEHHADPGSLHFDQPALPLVFLLLLAHACARILIWPAQSNITPLLVPTTALSNTITWNTSTFEIATVAGPALGGFLIFIGSSNEIGALRAGLMSALIGPVAAVVWGGIGTIAVAAAVARLVPGLRRLPELHSLKAEG